MNKLLTESCSVLIELTGGAGSLRVAYCNLTKSFGNSMSNLCFSSRNSLEYIKCSQDIFPSVNMLLIVSIRG